MPYEIFLENADDTEQKTEIIEKDELQEGDVILETIVEPAKTKEIEDEDGNNPFNHLLAFSFLLGLVCGLARIFLCLAHSFKSFRLLLLSFCYYCHSVIIIDRIGHHYR